MTSTINTQSGGFMDALPWVGNLFRLGLVGTGALVLLVWIGQILRFSFLAARALVTASMSNGMNKMNVGRRRRPHPQQ